MSWTINGTSNSSNNQFGVQLDHPNGGIVTYWSNVIGGTKINDVIVPLTAGGSGTQANTWYRFKAEITKLSATSARIDVNLVMLDASGNPTGTPLTGSIADTSALASGHTPDAGYFTPTTMYPSYKNYTSAAAPADNTCFEISNSVLFAAFGDYGSNSANELAVANLVNSWAPDFIITTGDNSYGSTAIDTNIGKYYSSYIGNYSGKLSPGKYRKPFLPGTGEPRYHGWRWADSLPELFHPAWGEHPQH